MVENEFQQTLVLIKPDALKYSLTGYILSQFSEFHTELKIAAMKVVNVSRLLAEEHYKEHKGKVFFDHLIDYIMGNIHYPSEPYKRVIAIIYHGKDAIKKIRDITGLTNPNEAKRAKPGCIRSLGAIIQFKDENGNVTGQLMENLVHASANIQDAEREIKLWFHPFEIPSFMRIFPYERSNKIYYFKNGRVYSYIDDFEIMIPRGILIWKSDIEILESLCDKNIQDERINSVIAKFYYE